MNVLIVEDEKLAAGRLEQLLKECDTSISVLSKIESVNETVKWLNNHPEPDLIFLDVQLEDDLSFAIFEKIQIKTPVIFTTAFDEYAIKAFKLNSIDYLLKPVNKEELQAALKKYQTWIKDYKPVDLRALLDTINKSSSEYKSRFIITAGSRIKTIGISEVAYFYSEEGITFLVTRQKAEYPIDLSLEKLADQINPDEFFRVNRQFILHIHAITNIHVYPKSRLRVELIPPPDKEIFVSLDKVTAFKDWLDR
jgi:DNA-binding LytR/AlgR family response regulator